MDKHCCADVQLGVVRDLAYPITKHAKILDFGCGNGDLVVAYRHLGFDAYGCDLQFKEGPNALSLEVEERIRMIEEPYRLPFANDSFDLVVSDQVFEHVRDFDCSFAEIHRVLKPSGLCLHTFPSRYSLIEPHVQVPLAGLIQCRPWLFMWALLSVRTPSQVGLNANEVSSANYDYLQRSTNYLTKVAIRDNAATYFRDVIFCEASYLKHSPVAFAAKRLGRFLPILGWIYSVLRMRVLLCAGKRS